MRNGWLAGWLAGNKCSQELGGRGEFSFVPIDSLGPVDEPILEILNQAPLRVRKPRGLFTFFGNSNILVSIPNKFGMGNTIPIKKISLFLAHFYKVALIYPKCLAGWKRLV